jgi:hypothetical protein
MSSQRRLVSLKRVAVVAALVAAPVLSAAAAAATGSPLTPASPRAAVHVDFGPAKTAAPHGYLVDYGLPFTAKRGYGWEKATNGKALSLVGNGVKRPSVHGRDHRYDTLMQMQAAHGPVASPGQWQVALRNGVYNVTVAVGDAATTNSVDRITAQPHTAAKVVLVGGFKPTSAHHFVTVTKKVRVTNGRLTLSPTGGHNTKLDFVVAVAVKDSTAPKATVSLSGTSSGSGVYTGSVRVAIAATDNAGGSGLKSIRYVLDGAPAQPYTSPLVVTTVGGHRLNVSAVDNAGNVGTASVSWTQQAVVPPPVAPTVPTVGVGLTGTTTAPGSYVGTVTATVTAAAAAGIGSLTYSLDGGAATAYTVPVLVTAAGSHTLVATATDTSGRVASATATWTQVAGTVSASCLVTGFDGVLPNTAGTQCDASKIAFVPTGLSLTSTAGQLANDDQQNALYKSFDASSGNFTVTARVVGPVNQLTTDYQQIGTFFGPDQDHFVKVEAEHNGTGAPHLTMYFRDGGPGMVVTTIPLSALTTANTLDLVIKSVAKQFTVFYSINGAALVQVGPAKSPATPSSWFSSAAKAGIEVSNSGTTTTFSAIFSQFALAGS